MSGNIYTDFISLCRVDSPIGHKHKNIYIDGKLATGTKYLELHHIKPRCDFKNKKDPLMNAPENLIYLTAGNHLKAHILLAELNPTHSGYRYAVHQLMRNRNPKTWRIKDEDWLNMVALEYENHKIKLGEIVSKQMMGNNFNVGKKLSEEHKQNISKGYTPRILTQAQIEHKIKISTGRRHSEETKNKLRQLNLGKKISEETKKKIGNAGKDRNATTWNITLPSGEKITITNLKKFCDLHNISQGNIIAHGHTKGYYGVRISKS